MSRLWPSNTNGERRKPSSNSARPQVRKCVQMMRMEVTSCLWDAPCTRKKAHVVQAAGGADIGCWHAAHMRSCKLSRRSVNCVHVCVRARMCVL